MCVRQCVSVSANMCAYCKAYMYICMCVLYVCVCVCVYIGMCVFMCVCVLCFLFVLHNNVIYFKSETARVGCMWMFVSVCACVCVCVCVCVCTRVCVCGYCLCEWWYHSETGNTTISFVFLQIQLNP